MKCKSPNKKGTIVMDSSYLGAPSVNPMAMSHKQRAKGRYRVSGRKRLVTREIAALSFLQNIPMAGYG